MNCRRYTNLIVLHVSYKMKPSLKLSSEGSRNSYKHT